MNRITVRLCDEHYKQNELNLRAGQPREDFWDSILDCHECTLRNDVHDNSDEAQGIGDS